MTAPLFQPLPQGERASEREARIIAFWNERDIFRKSMRLDDRSLADSDVENFVFYEGPPTANALPGVHHAAARIVKDLFCRYQTMKGKRVVRKGGWDTHGLPVELEVEKQLGLKSKSEVETYGVARFNKECRERVMRFANEWKRLSERIGFWTDADNAYVTCSNEYIESVWWILKQLFERREGGGRLIYEGHRVVPYCPRCETSLSSHEVSQGYKDVQDPSVFVRFRVKGNRSVSFLVWTTTPWTLVSNVALAVHPDIKYALVQLRTAEGTAREEFWIAEDRVSHVFGRDAVPQMYKKGADLVAEGLRYEPLFPYADAGDSGYRLVSAEFVSVEDGTGIVHMAPAFGEDDAAAARQWGLPTLQPVDASGHFTADVTPWAGRFVKDADADIIRDLKTRGLLFKRDTIVHSYPHCWRCESPLLYYAKKSWFVRTTALQDELIEENEKIGWHPPEIGRGRFGEWLRGNVDWNLSRDRYWGTPLPIWRCAACGPERDVCVGSFAELRERSGRPLDGFDLHKPFVDEVELHCEACGGPMRRVSPVIDAWFDSGAMPFAQWHYPFENCELIEKGPEFSGPTDAARAALPWEQRKQFPADFIAEGLDQTRGWFYSLLAISTLLPGEGHAKSRGTSYKNCVVIGLIQDEHGKKMSKSKGNVVDPWKVVEAEGADALRWYLVSTGSPDLPKRFSLEDVADAGRRYLGTLENLYAFFALYAGIDGYTPSPSLLRDGNRTDLAEIDRWILARLQDVADKVDKCLGDDKTYGYDPHGAARALLGFVIEDLSNWYVRRSRSRFWAGGVERDKLDAFDTLYKCLVRVAHLTAPLTPFIAEDLYQRLVVPFSRLAEPARGGVGATQPSPESIHLAPFPKTTVDRALDRAEETFLARMDLIRDIVGLGRAARNEAGIKVRQPLSGARVSLSVAKHAFVPADEKPLSNFKDIIRDELNLKDVVFVDENALADHLRVSLRLKFDKFGPRLGKKAKAFAAAMQALPESSLWDYARGRLTTIDVDAEPVALAGDEAEVKREAIAPHEVYAQDGEVGFLLDTTITDELRDEGLVREVINKVQFMRKEADYQVTDRIRIGIVTTSERLRRAIERHEDHLKNETLAVEVGFDPIDGEPSRPWDINGEPAEISIPRVAVGASPSGRGIAR